MLSLTRLFLPHYIQILLMDLEIVVPVSFFQPAALPFHGLSIDFPFGLHGAVELLHGTVRVGRQVPVNADRCHLPQVHSGVIEAKLQRVDRISTKSMFLPNESLMSFPGVHRTRSR